MKTRRLGASGPLISAIGYGAMSFTDFYGTTDQSQSHAVLAAALDEGITHIDTSNVYGPHRSEAAIGSFLAKQGNQRHDLFSIATKAGITRDPDTGARVYNNSAAHLEAELDGSLARLGVDRVDLFYVHRRDAATPIEEVTETLAGLIKKGKIGGFGYSEIAPSSLRRAHAVHPVMAVQSEYSLAVRYPELGLVQATAALGTALDEGITHIDTSNVYGPHRSEAAIGSFLAKQGNQRHDLFSIATKAGITRDPDTGARVYNNSAAHLESELDGSLARLGVDRVDLFYVHRRDAATPIVEVTETHSGLIKKGKIGGFGYSEIAPSSLRRAHAVHPVMAVQSEYSLAVRYPELGLVQTTAALGTALVAFSPVGRSLLTDKPHSPEKAAELPFLKVNPRFQEPNLSANIAATESFRRLAADMGTTAAALSIAWLLHQGEHVIPIPGTRSPEHLRQHCEGARLELDDAALAAIDAALPVGWAHGDRYSAAQWDGPEKYC
ncbi:MAG: aldo/keto reductase [Pseudomonadota bacterium]|nr:aldo/keto reductase [Pseudomonadota bacterium]